MDEKRNLFSLASDIEEVGSRLEELALLMNILDDEMEEGYQLPNRFVDWRAIVFVKRLPRRMAIFRAIQREFGQCIKTLDELTSQLMEMSKNQKETIP